MKKQKPKTIRVAFYSLAAFFGAGLLAFWLGTRDHEETSPVKRGSELTAQATNRAPNRPIAEKTQASLENLEPLVDESEPVEKVLAERDTPLSTRSPLRRQGPQRMGVGLRSRRSLSTNRSPPWRSNRARGGWRR